MPARNYVLARRRTNPRCSRASSGTSSNRPNDPRIRGSQHATRENAHSRQDKQSYIVCPVPRGLPDAERWRRLAAIGMVTHESIRDGKECRDVRYYIMRFSPQTASFWVGKVRAYRRGKG